MTRTPKNTSDPDEVRDFALMTFMGVPTEERIYAQEAAGQQELVNSEVLPSEILHCTQADFEALGFTFGDPVPNDPLFRQATLPKGWSRQGTDHSMWSEIVDERGLARVSIFYKAAFYDRKAHMSIKSVGAAFTQGWIYGDEEVLDQETLGKLTDAERHQARLQVEQYVCDAEAHPSIYGTPERMERVRALMAVLPPQ